MTEMTKLKQVTHRPPQSLLDVPLDYVCESFPPHLLAGELAANLQEIKQINGTCHTNKKVILVHFK